MNKIYGLVIGLIVFSSCIKEFNEPIIEPKGEGMEALQVPNGFNYEMYESQNLDISFESSTARLAGETSLQFAIIGTDSEGKIYTLKTGWTSISDGLNYEIQKPIHITDLFLYTKFNGNAQFFPLVNEPLELNVDDLYVSEHLFTGENARMASVPSCTSFLGNATQISCKNGKITIKSSASILSADLAFLDGTRKNYLINEVGSTNANQNQWDFVDPVDGHTLDEIISFTIYSECLTNPQEVGTELVTFYNPCMPEGQDTDGDGVADASDLNPLDPTIAAVDFYPARDRYATFAFEDLWPYKGDYDFNDLVVSHQGSVYSNASGLITKTDYMFVIRAIGAGFNNDFCISFSDPDHTMQVSTISPADITYSLHQLEGKTEIRFPEFKGYFGTGGFVNTDTTRAFVEPITINMTLTFSGTLPNESFEIDEYLRINQEEGREAHKPGKPYTSLMDISMIGTAADDTNPSANKYFLTKENLPWALEIPTEWDYPKEQSDITKGYPNFKDFAQGRSKTPWYTDAEGNKVHKHLYMRR